MLDICIATYKQTEQLLNEVVIDLLVVRGAKMHFPLRSNSVPSSDNSFKGRRGAFLLLLLWHEKSICHEMQEGLSSGLRRGGPLSRSVYNCFYDGICAVQGAAVSLLEI